MLELRKDKNGRAVFDILFWGKKNPDKITIQKIKKPLKRNPSSEKFIKNEWQKRVASGLKPWPNDALPSRYGFNGLEISGNSIRILSGSVLSYRDIIGSRPIKFRELFSREYWPVPLTADMVVLAKNKKGEDMIGITLRNASQDQNGGGIHTTTGGAIEIKKDKKPIDAALRETEEEMGIKPEELSGVYCRGILFNPHLSEIGIIFVATADIPVEEIKTLVHDNENEIMFISAQKKNLEYWLLKLTYANSHDGIIGMLMAGEDLYGKKWKDAMMDKLIKNNQEYLNPHKRGGLEKSGIKKLKKWLNKKSPR